MASLFRRNITFLVCDMAGTVINENGIIYNSLEKVLKNMGCVITQEMKETWYGQEKKKVLVDTLYEMDNQFPEVKNLKYLLAKAEHELENELNKNFFENGELEIIDPSNFDFFSNLRIQGCVDDYISSDMCRIGRPYPYMIHNLMERNSIYDVRNVAKAGDTINDMWEGRNAGVGLRIGVLSGAETRANLFPHADVIVNKITDLKDDDLPVFLL